MKRVISYYNLHSHLDEENDTNDTSDVIELVRSENDAQGLINLFTPRPTFHLHMRPHNPYSLRNMVSTGPLLRCSHRRACDTCAVTPCGQEQLCPACLNDEVIYCLHRSACLRWTPDQVRRFQTIQSQYVPRVASDSASTDYQVTLRRTPEGEKVTGCSRGGEKVTGCSK